MGVETAALAAYVLALADDELILGHRDSEWTGHAPILEEDIAFANIALDELGHAQLWYGLRQELTGEEPDRLVFFREPSAFRCARLVELPRGDWAFTMVRQYLFDAAESVRLAELSKSTDGRVAEIAAKIRPEEVYHLRHTSNWVKRLGLGTDESHRRMQDALNALWSDAVQLLAPIEGESLLVERGMVPASSGLLSAWEEKVIPFLSDAGMMVPTEGIAAAGSRQLHTAHLAELVAEMQQVARLEPFGTRW